MIVEMMIALSVGAGLFGIGLYGALSQTNLVMIIMGVELIWPQHWSIWWPSGAICIPMNRPVRCSC